MNQQIDKCGAARRERIGKADRLVAEARELAQCWRYPNGFSHYMTAVDCHTSLRCAEWLYEDAGLSVIAQKVRRLCDSEDVPAAWLKFDK